MWTFSPALNVFNTAYTLSALKKQAYLHLRLQFALEGEIDQVRLQTQRIVNGTNVSRQPHEGPPLRHADSSSVGSVSTKRTRKPSNGSIRS